MKLNYLLGFLLFYFNSPLLTAQQVLEPIDVFQLEYASDPRISSDGNTIIYVRNFKDIMVDANRSNLWKISSDGSQHQPLTTGTQNDANPRFSPDGKKLLYTSNKDGTTQFYCRWLNSVAEAKLTNLTQSPGSPVWSPDGQWVAFTMFVPENTKPFTAMPEKPKGATWNDPPTYIDDMKYRSDGAGYLKKGFRQIFVITTDGGTPRQLTTGDYHHNSEPSWSADGQFIYFSANRNKDHETDPNNSEVYKVNVKDGTITALTKRHGPDNNPKVSPDGSKIAYIGFDEQYHGYQVRQLYVMNMDGTSSKSLTSKLDRDVENIQWADDSQGLYFKYDSEGNSKLGFVTLDGNVKTLTGDLGGLSLGRPYDGAEYHVNKKGQVVFTHSLPDHPADVAIYNSNGKVKRLTHLNNDLFDYKELGQIEEIWYKSSFDGRKVQGWICKPPGFDPNKKYPLILEIHGGPFANYGNRFSAEVQLFAAAGYVVLYTNPRGSTSYGKEFGNLIHHNYPGQDYDDLISGVDAVIEKGYVDPNRLYVTGGSGGGVLTSWIVGKTNRFKAAVVAKPVINWYSFVLYADNPNFFYKYWFPGKPWDHMEHYMKRSPLTYAGNVKTPTMLLTGEEDFRTPMAETEQFYAALKLSGVETAMVRIPGASHGIARRPSNLIAKVVYILEWFKRYR